MNASQIVSFTDRAVDRKLSEWAANPSHIDYEADEFKQQAAIDLWMALQRRPTLTESAMVTVIRRSMASLIRKRIGKDGRKAMRRMCTERLDCFAAPASDYPFILYDAIDYVASRMDGGTSVILACIQNGARTTEIIRAMQISVSSFYLRLRRIQDAMRRIWEN